MLVPSRDETCLVSFVSQPAPKFSVADISNNVNNI